MIKRNIFIVSIYIVFRLKMKIQYILFWYVSVGALIDWEIVIKVINGIQAIGFILVYIPDAIYYFRKGSPSFFESKY